MTPAPPEPPRYASTTTLRRQMSSSQISRPRPTARSRSCSDDRRQACPSAGTAEAAAAGLALDTANQNYSGALPPYSVTNYCVNSAVQFYRATLNRIGNNIRLSPHAFDPQLNSP